MARSDSPPLTDEQQSVVNHPPGSHARVRAVAGSGKTTAMVHRLKHLLASRSVPAQRILILMFNAMARQEFKAKAESIGLPTDALKRVHTFHSFSFQLIRSVGLLGSSTSVWAEDKAELQRLTIKRAITAAEKAGLVERDSIDPQTAEEAIGLWKGSLIPPLLERAGHRSIPEMAHVYIEYEKLRTKARGVTYDDFVPYAVEAIRSATRPLVPSYAHIIVDEYQDVNYGQQTLLESIAGERAEVMVVGDDDQTIYEWRGARPEYINSLFGERFHSKPTTSYVLSHSFRFGPLLAQAAENVIGLNEQREHKPVIAHAVDKQTSIDVITTSSEQPSDVDRVLREQVWARLIQAGIPVSAMAAHVAVLGRTFAQLAAFESELLAHSIPYRVVGQSPFFERREVALLLNYLRVAGRLKHKLRSEDVELFLSIMNVPNRFLPRADVERLAKNLQGEPTVLALLEHLHDADRSPLLDSQREKVQELWQRVGRLQEVVDKQEGRSAAEVLTWFIEVLGYREYFRDYYGDGSESEERLQTLDAFLAYCAIQRVTIGDLLAHVDRLDPTAGAPIDQQVTLTTVFRTKGLEFDYVIIPSCLEGFMPMAAGTECPVFDIAGLVSEPTPSPAIESER